MRRISAAADEVACIGLGALEVLGRDPEGVIAVVPSDQYATRLEPYHAAVQRALELARRDVVVTVGIPPTGPETGYGYLEMGGVQDGARQVKRFVEKPDLATAQRYVSSGDYLWNSGMFFFRARRMLEHLGTHLPELARILGKLEVAPDRAAELYPTAPSISIDYAVMEKLAPQEILVVPGDFGWSDVGSWSALPSVAQPDPQGNTTVGISTVIDASGNVLYGEPGKLIAAVGVHDLIIVAAGDAVLVLPKSRAQDVKEIIRALETSKRDSYL